MEPTPLSSVPFPFREFGGSTAPCIERKEHLLFSSSMYLPSSESKSCTTLEDVSSNKNEDQDLPEAFAYEVENSLLPIPQVSAPLLHQVNCERSSLGDRKKLFQQNIWKRLSSAKSEELSRQHYKSPSGGVNAVNDSPEETKNVLEEVRLCPVSTYDSLYSRGSYPKGISKLSVPVMNSSRVLQLALVNADEKLGEDDFTVSTVTTTETMRMRAAAVASNVRQKGVIYDYDKLIPLYTDAPQCKMQSFSRKVKPAKQLDNAWLVRKHNLSPTHEDVQVLHTSDPCIAIKLKVGNNDRDFTLSAVVNEDSYECTFNLIISQEEIYGIMFPERSLSIECLVRTVFNGKGGVIDTFDMVNMC